MEPEVIVGIIASAGAFVIVGIGYGLGYTSRNGDIDYLRASEARWREAARIAGTMIDSAAAASRNRVGNLERQNRELLERCGETTEET